MGTTISIALFIHEMNIIRDKDDNTEYKLLKDNIISEKEYVNFKTNKKIPIINGEK